jgi:hypothetical protein
MTKNVTLRMDEEILRQAKHVAVEENMSLSAWIADVVKLAVESDVAGDLEKGSCGQSESPASAVMEDAVTYRTHCGAFDRERFFQILNRLAAKQHISLSTWISRLAEDAVQWEAGYEQRKKAAWSVLDKTFRLGGEKFDREACYDRIP